MRATQRTFHTPVGKPRILSAGVNFLKEVIMNKPTPQRTYTRKGVIFKTIDGVRRKFGEIMVLEFKASQDIDEEILKREIVIASDNQLKKLNVCNEIAYIQQPAEVSIYGDDYIQNLMTVQIKFKRVKPN